VLIYQPFYSTTTPYKFPVKISACPQYAKKQKKAALPHPQNSPKEKERG